MSRALVQNLPHSLQPQPMMLSHFSLGEMTVGGHLAEKGACLGKVC